MNISLAVLQKNKLKKSLLTVTNLSSSLDSLYKTYDADYKLKELEEFMNNFYASSISQSLMDAYNDYYNGGKNNV